MVTQRMRPPGAALPPPSRLAFAAARMPSASVPTQAGSEPPPPTRSGPAPSSAAALRAGAVALTGTDAGGENLTGNTIPMAVVHGVARGAPEGVGQGMSQLRDGSGRAPASVPQAVPAKATPAEKATPGETWFVSIDGQEHGPLTARDIAQLLEQGQMDWSSQVWRTGLKGWRPARRDPQLVTAVAGAHGVANDTTRLDAARSFLAPEDTVVDAPPRVSPRPSGDKAPRLRALRQAELPDLRPSARPQAWHSPENAAFREALGLPTDSSQQPVREKPAATLADALRSAPTLLGAEPAAPASRPVRSRTLVAVAVVSFAAGALAAALVGRLGSTEPLPTASAEHTKAEHTESEVRAPAVVVQEAAEPEEPSRREDAVLPVQTVQRLPPTVDEPPRLRELPTAEDLRAAVRKVAGEVKRCMYDPVAGVDVDIYIDGPSGRVRDVDVRSPLITPARADCIQRAVRRMQVPPFTRSELKLMHKFSW